MEVTALKESSEDVRHFADRIFTKRGARYRRVAMFPTGYDDAPPEGTIDDRDDMVTCPFRVHNGPDSAETGLPKCSREQTFAVLVGMSQTCQTPNMADMSRLEKPHRILG
jgi:hypothetical protein